MARSRSDEDYDDDSPRRKRPERDEYGDAPRRGGRDDDYDRPVGNRPKTMSVLGLLSLICGILALLISFVPCVGMIAIPGSIIGILMALVGWGMAGKANQGKGLPISGLIVNVLSILVMVGWLVFFAANSKSTTQQEVETADAIQIPAGQLCREYRTNVVKADEDYKGKVLEVTGQVKLVSKERIGRLTVELGGQTDTIDCDFGSSNKSELAGIEIGQTVTIRGKCKGVDRKSDYVVLGDCKVVNKGEPVANPDAQGDKVEVTKLLKAYEDDDAAANKTYKNKSLEVTGTITDISKEKKSETVIFFRGKGVWYIECRLTPEAGKAANLKAAQKVTLRGTCVGSQEENSILLENVTVLK
jgi:hypothetical protein